MEKHNEHLRDIINTIYESAGVNIKFRGNVTPELAEVMGDLLIEIRSCSGAFTCVPQPSEGRQL